MFGMVIETGPKFYKILLPTKYMTAGQGHRLRILFKSFVIFFFYFLQFQFSQSLQWILFICGVTIEPCLKFYAEPSPSQCKALRSRSQTLIFLCNVFTVSVFAKPLIDLNHV